MGSFMSLDHERKVEVFVGDALKFCLILVHHPVNIYDVLEFYKFVFLVVVFMGLFILYDDLLFAEVHNVESLWIWFKLKHFDLLDLFPNETAQDEFSKLGFSNLLTVIL